MTDPIPHKVDEFVRRAVLDRVVDGDTVDLVIDQGWDLSLKERVRLIGVDTPELRGEEKERGYAFKEFVEAWFSRRPSVWLESVDYKRGSFGRTLGRIFDDEGDCLNDRLAEML